MKYFYAITIICLALSCDKASNSKEKPLTVADNSSAQWEYVLGVCAAGGGECFNELASISEEKFYYSCSSGPGVLSHDECIPVDKSFIDANCTKYPYKDPELRKIHQGKFNCSR